MNEEKNSDPLRIDPEQLRINKYESRANEAY